MLSHVLQTFCQVVCILAYFLTNFNKSLPKLKVTENVLVYFKTVQMYEIFWVRVFYSLTLRLFEKAQRVKDILVPPKCLLLFQKK